MYVSVALAAVEPLTLCARFWPLSLMMRSRSAAGLKSTPKRPVERYRERVQRREHRRGRVDRVHAASVAHSIKEAVLHPEVDSDERGIGPGEA